jgi:hypothetical protein
VFDLFGETSKAHVFVRDELRAAPLLRDVDTALKADALNSHERHFRCSRHMLESLGSRTVIAVRARRLLFTKTPAADDKLLQPTLSGFTARYRADFIIACRNEQFCQLSDVNLIDVTARPTLSDTQEFERQTL